MSSVDRPGSCDRKQSQKIFRCDRNQQRAFDLAKGIRKRAISTVETVKPSKQRRLTLLFADPEDDKLIKRIIASAGRPSASRYMP